MKKKDIEDQQDIKEKQISPQGEINYTMKALRYFVERGICSFYFPTEHIK